MKLCKNILSNIHFPSHTYKSHFEATDKNKEEQLNNDKCVGEECRTFIVYLQIIQKISGIISACSCESNIRNTAAADLLNQIRVGANIRIIRIVQFE